MQNLMLGVTIANIILAVVFMAIGVKTRNVSAALGWGVAVLANTQLLLTRI